MATARPLWVGATGSFEMSKAKAIAISDNRTGQIIAAFTALVAAILFVDVVSLLVGGVGPLLLER